METMTTDRQQAVFGMPVSGRVRMSTAPVTSQVKTIAAAGVRGVEGTAVSAHGYQSVIVFALDAVPGHHAWSPPI